MLLVVIEICLIIIYRLYINKKVFPDDEIVRLVLGDSKLYFLYYSPVNSFIPGLSVQGMLNLLFHFNFNLRVCSRSIVLSFNQV
jgi:hypothetical protein